MDKIKIGLNKYGRFEPREQPNKIIKSWRNWNSFSRLDTKHPVDFLTHQQAKKWVKALEKFIEKEKYFIYTEIKDKEQQCNEK
jgi:hypothetical protein